MADFILVAAVLSYPVFIFLSITYIKKYRKMYRKRENIEKTLEVAEKNMSALENQNHLLVQEKEMIIRDCDNEIEDFEQKVKAVRETVSLIANQYVNDSLKYILAGVNANNLESKVDPIV